MNTGYASLNSQYLELSGKKKNVVISVKIVPESTGVQRITSAFEYIHIGTSQKCTDIINFI